MKKLCICVVALALSACGTVTFPPSTEPYKRIELPRTEGVSSQTGTHWQ